MTELLSDIAIQRELGSLNGWTRRGGAIVKTYQFRSFPEGIAFIGRVADVAEAANHHPDIDIRWQRIRFILTTHDAGDKITARDLEMAAHIDAIAAGHGAKPVPPETS